MNMIAKENKSTIKPCPNCKRPRERETSDKYCRYCIPNKPPCPDCGRTDAEYFNKKYWCLCGTFFWTEKGRGEIS